MVFARDASSGELALAREIRADSSPGNPLQELHEFRLVSLDGNGTILFVSGRPTAALYSFDAGIAAFDISDDPADPAYLDTISGFFYHNNRDTVFVPNHMRSTLGGLSECRNLVPHVGQSAVDVFCERGFYVVAWNATLNALEVTDFAVFGAQDRFGNTLPYHLGGGWRDRRQMAQSPDGAHVYRATRLENREYADAIHIYERASAMTPDASGENGGGEVTAPTDGVDDATESEAKGDCYVGLLVGIGESCTYPGTTDEFSVNARGRGSFLGRLAGIRIRINNETINGFLYNFEASHQGDGVWRIDRVAGVAVSLAEDVSTETFEASTRKAALRTLTFGPTRPDS